MDLMALWGAVLALIMGPHGQCSALNEIPDIALIMPFAELLTVHTQLHLRLQMILTLLVS